MNKIKQVVVTLHSYFYILRMQDRDAGDDIGDSVKRSTLMTLGMPPNVLAVVLYVLLVPQRGEDEFKVFVVVAALVSIFGIAFFTDRIYDRSAPTIERLAREAIDDPEKGEDWARRRILGILAAQFGFIVTMALLGRAYVIYGTDLPLISM